MFYMTFVNNMLGIFNTFFKALFAQKIEKECNCKSAAFDRLSCAR